TDPNGNILATPTTKQYSLKLKPSGALIEKYFLYSKKHLTHASRRTAKPFPNKVKEADGLHHWKLKGVFNAEAFELVIEIIYGKTRETPQDVSLDLMARIAAIADNLVCHDALSFYR
ncbi:hypothetical protein IL306_009399, partial [Fusarium sp. DS 682]